MAAAGCGDGEHRCVSYVACDAKLQQCELDSWTLVGACAPPLTAVSPESFKRLETRVVDVCKLSAFPVQAQLALELLACSVPVARRLPHDLVRQICGLDAQQVATMLRTDCHLNEPWRGMWRRRFTLALHKVVLPQVPTLHMFGATMRGPVHAFTFLPPDADGVSILYRSSTNTYHARLFVLCYSTEGAEYEGVAAITLDVFPSSLEHADDKGALVLVQPGMDVHASAVRVRPVLTEGAQPMWASF
jgi:hypothetical protein